MTQVKGHSGVGGAGANPPRATSEQPARPMPLGSGGAPAVGLVPTPLVEAQFEPAPMVDRVERADRPREAPVERSVGSDRAQVREQHNPFPKVDAKVDAEPLRFLAPPADARQEVDLPVEVLGALGQAELALGAEHASSFNKVRLGNMLVTTDGQAVRAQRVPVDGEAITTLIKALNKAEGKQQAQNEAVEAFAKQSARFLGGERANIAAIVQRVLRESYLVQSDVLLDYAEKVKFFNAQKQKVRDRLTELRETKTQWVALSHGDPLYTHPRGVPHEILNDNGEWEQTVTSEANVEAWQSAREAAEGAPEASAESFFVRSESLLTSREKEVLKKALQCPDAEWISGHIDMIKEAVSKMTQAEFDHYFVPRYMNDDEDNEKVNLLTSLCTGDMDAVYGLITSLSPEQTAHLVTRIEPGWMPITDLYRAPDIFTSHGFSDAQQETLAWHLEDTLSELAQTVGKTAGYPMDLETGTSLRDALVAQAERTSATAPPSEAGIDTLRTPRVGEPRQLHTQQELTDHIDSLEEELNTIGDDAQLANVDLNNALQAQQQTLQMMSNISKMLHDTAMSVIRKSGQ